MIAATEIEILNPFPGLRPFEPEEDYLFFGREQQTDELLRRTRFLAVVGGSGSGKSSLVRAGLVPSLYGGFMARAGSIWRTAIFRPGDQPLRNLAEAGEVRLISSVNAIRTLQSEDVQSVTAKVGDLKSRLEKEDGRVEQVVSSLHQTTENMATDEAFASQRNQELSKAVENAAKNRK